LSIDPLAKTAPATPQDSICGLRKKKLFRGIRNLQCEIENDLSIEKLVVRRRNW
jgi:hypothetical protein